MKIIDPSSFDFKSIDLKNSSKFKLSKIYYFIPILLITLGTYHFIIKNIDNREKDYQNELLNLVIDNPKMEYYFKISIVVIVSVAGIYFLGKVFNISAKTIRSYKEFTQALNA